MSDNQPNGLSERELEILRLIATGASNKDIAQQLVISANTVKVHLRNIFPKIGVTSRTEAALYAVKNGLASQSEVVVIEEPEVEIGSSIGESGTQFEFAAERNWVRNRGTLLSASLVILLLGLLGSGVYWILKPTTPAIAQPTPISTFASWEEIAPLPQSRKSLAMAVYNSKLYAIGGEGSQGVTNVVQQYDLKTNQWTDIISKPVGVADASAAVIGGLIYIPGGRQASGALTTRLDVYDPKQNLWEERASLPVAISSYALTTYEGKLFLFGGWDGHQYVDSVYVYDPNLDSWTSKSPMPTKRGNAGAVSAAGNIYVIGGRNSQGALADNEVYSPDRDNGIEQSWSEAPSMPDKRYAMGVVEIADIVYILGGEGESNQLLPTYEFIPREGTWGLFANPPVTTTYSYMATASLGTRVYSVGGQLGNALAQKSFAIEAIKMIAVPLVK